MNKKLTPLLCILRLCSSASFMIPQHHKAALSLVQYQSSTTRQFSAHQNDQQIVTVSLETSSGTKELQIQKGEILRSAMLRRGSSPHNGRSRLINCRGLGTCGTCAVEIESSDDINNNKSGVVEPNERNTKERMRLNFPPHGSSDQSANLRLACQVQVMDDITIRKRTGFWGQGTTSELAEEYDAELWFGDLEYVLDNKSPQREED
mmetsp:Transcript_21804/g.31217  ORF Transcript_21804/g.31217 Transcript_21804/m.31217 type:complete len:206 (+) Transcript_21804:71-688(+)|eukprot:CAMPEP_0201693802 /NCGR_PEP_ID=MMETSP0578-20130828/6270_1 /ASSEMBLY_ACC=CAM_ASM_000663 /TAXON_ID=267565 /ORGANISM="Skeletonema grethea, Strain CCMP 1804" /LENGTH=205 /DNA_ID=CAMNT_0048179383 /DNA_START=42 /DNA_END=659 /DNA_ORIENTATION=+